MTDECAHVGNGLYRNVSSDVSKTFGERETRYQTKGYVSVEEAFKTINTTIGV